MTLPKGPGFEVPAKFSKNPIYANCRDTIWREWGMLDTSMPMYQTLVILREMSFEEVFQVVTTTLKPTSAMAALVDKARYLHKLRQSPESQEVKEL